ncbi:hypothetical protein SLA2020_059590 [Shorea laevis]
MKKGICANIKNFLSNTASGGNSTAPAATGVDVREEYANAFRTESYNQFWTRVLAIPHKNSATCISPAESTAADRLTSYRLFAEHLLDPDQPTVSRILSLTQHRPAIHNFLWDYFSQTANASVLCGLLLKDVDRTRVRYHAFKKSLPFLENVEFSNENTLPGIITHLTQLSNVRNPFSLSDPSSCRLQSIQISSSELLKRLESSRDKSRAKLRLINGLQHSSGIFLVVLATSLTVIVASHALALLVAAPGLIMASFELASMKRLVRVSAQLDTAAKGTYILSRDLETTSRLVARLSDELEHMRTMVRFWLNRGDDRLQASSEVVRQLKNSDASFSQQLDELEEHLYLCFMNINRIRNLVVKEMSDLGRLSTQDANMISKGL